MGLHTHWYQQKLMKLTPCGVAEKWIACYLHTIPFHYQFKILKAMTTVGQEDSPQWSSHKYPKSLAHHKKYSNKQQ
jgi:hypothetical protein